MRYTDFIWDFDGTLIDTYPGMVDAFYKALRDFGIDTSRDEILKHIKDSVTHAVNYFADRYSIERSKLGELFGHYEDNMDIGMLHPFSYVIDICSSIISSGGRNFVLTHRGNSTLKFLTYYNMAYLFTEVVTREYGFKRKPDPEAFIYIIDKYHVDRTKALAVGDRPLDIDAGRNAGINTCFFNSYRGMQQNFIPMLPDADHIINSMDELYSILGLSEDYKKH